MERARQQEKELEQQREKEQELQRLREQEKEGEPKEQEKEEKVEPQEPVVEPATENQESENNCKKGMVPHPHFIVNYAFSLVVNGGEVKAGACMYTCDASSSRTDGQMEQVFLRIKTVNRSLT